MPAGSSRAWLSLVLLGWSIWGEQALATEANNSTNVEASNTSEANDISLPLKDNGFSLGDIIVRTGNDNAISLQRAGFLAAIKRIMRPEALAALEGSLPGVEFLTLKQIDAAGISCEYDEERLELKVDPKVEQRPRGVISGGIASQELTSGDYAQPALLSGYLNMRLGADYDRSLGESTGAISMPAGAFEGAVRLADVVLEGEFDVDPSGKAVRRGTRAIYDLADDAVRITAGDLPLSMGSGRPLPPLVGVTVEKSYAKLQPTRNIRPTGRRSFRIERPSEIQVLLNGKPIRRLMVGPGEYDLDTLPLVPGNNQVELLIKDETGREEKLDFSILFDRSLLSVGLSEWSVTAGMAASTDHILIYDYSQPFSSVSYRYGLLENLTTEFSLETSRETATLGTSLLSQTPFGLVVLDGAASGGEGKDFGVFAAADLEVALAEITDSPSSLRFGVELQTEDFVFAGDSPSQASTWLRTSASYSRAIAEGLTAGVSARYAFGHNDAADRYGLGLTLSQSLGDGAMLSLSGRYGSEPLLNEKAGLPGVSLFGRLSYRFDSKSDVGLAVDPLQQRVTTNVGTAAGNGVGRWSTNIEYARQAGAEGERADNALEGAFSYAGNRFELSTLHGRQFAGLQQANNVHHSINLGSAIAFADGAVAVGRPVHSSFALVDEHPALKESKLRIAPSDTGDTGTSDGVGPVIVSELAPYTPTRVGYDFDNAPAGHDVGTGSLDFRPSYKSGHHVTIGSGLTVTASGTLFDADNRPIKLLGGVAFDEKQPDRQITIFTNADGVFSALGLGPGDWVIEISEQTAYRFKFSLPEGASGEIELGVLTPARPAQ